jgi:small-conductance mechanosensitive channel
MNEQLEALFVHLKEVFSTLSTPLFTISNTKISVTSILISIAVIVFAFQIAKYTGRLLNSALKSRSVDSGVRDSLEKFVRYVIIILGVLFAMDNMGVSINSLAAIGAVLMVGIGFGLQNITQNFMAGLIILIERPIKVGDIVNVGNTSGRVLDIRVRSTVIETRDNVTIIIPNSKFVSEEVTNDSYSGQTIRHHIRVGVAYGSDVEKVKKLLCTAGANHEKTLKNPPPAALLEDFGDSSLNFDLRFWCSDIWHMEKISSDIRCDIDRLFRENNVEIPFPQRDIHIKTTKGSTPS